MPDKNKQGRIFLLDRAKAAQTGTFWLSLFQEEKLVRDLVGGQDLSNPGGFTIDEGGSVATFNGAQQQNKAIVFPSGFGIGNIIVAARIKATAAQAASPGVAFGIAASDGLQTGVGVGFDASNNVGHAFLDSYGAGLRGYSAGALNTYYTVFAQRLSYTNAYGWINGNPATTSQGAVGGSGGTINELVIGAQHRSEGYLRQFKGTIEWAALIYLPKAGTSGTDGVMSDEFAKYLYESNYPYSLEAKPSRIWVGGVAGGDVTLAAAATSQATASANLTTAIPITAAALGIGTATASLSTAIPLSGVAASVASGSGALTAQVRLSADALAQAVSAAALSSGIILTAAAVAQAAAAGTLSSAIQLIANAAAQASAPASLTAGSSGLAANAQASASASAALTIQIQLSAAALAQATASASLTAASSGLSATASASASAQGDITTQIKLNAAALAEAIAVGGLTARIDLTANAITTADASAWLLTAVQLAADASVISTAEAALTGGSLSVVRYQALTVDVFPIELTVDVFPIILTADVF